MIGITVGDAETPTPKMNKYIDEYNAYAEQCRQLAALSLKRDDKTFWLRLAEEWARLAEVIAGNGQRAS